MMVSAFEVYTQVMTLSRKLEVQREVQESARAITEAIAKDVREKGFVIADPAKLYQT
jgi:type II secretory pathway component PulJ